MKTYLKYAGNGVGWGVQWVEKKEDATHFDSEADARSALKKGESQSIEKFKNLWVVGMQAKQQRKQQGGATTGQQQIPNPFTDKQPKGDMADRIGSFATKSFSPGGLINFGGIVFGSAAILNAGFWAAVFTGMPCDRHIEKILMGDLGLLGLASAGWLLSAGTTLFQTYPIVAKKSGESIAKQFLASLFRPDLTKLKGGEYELADAHNTINRDFWKFMGWAWFLCTTFEVMGGIIFVGPVFGQGLASLLSLLLFLYSIAGCQVGAFFIVMGQNMRLPQSGRGLVRRLEQQAVSDAYKQLK